MKVLKIIYKISCDNRVISYTIKDCYMKTGLYNILLFILLFQFNLFAQTSPSWINEHNIFVGKTIDNSLLQFKPTILGWGWNDPMSPFVVDWAHDNKMKFIGEVSMWNYTAWETVEDLPPELKSAVCIDIDGNVMMKQGLVWMNTNDPAFQNRLITFCKAQIDLGADGLLFDEFTGSLVSLSEGGTFDIHSLIGFRDYLKTKYSTQELIDKYEINDISTFNYRDYLIGHGLENEYRDDFNNTILSSDYVMYHGKAIKEFFINMVDSMKNYATMKGTDLAITANTYAMFNWFLWNSDQLDYFTYEHEYLGPLSNSTLEYPPRRRSTAYIKLGRAIDNKLSAIVLSADSYGKLSQLPSSSANALLKLWMSEIYASQGVFIYHDWIDFMGYNFVADRGIITKHFNFIGNNPQYYKNMEVYSNIGVLYSQPTMQFTNEKSYYGAGDILLDSHLQFDVIFAGYENIINEFYALHKELNFEDIKKYKLIILPNSQYLSGETINTLLHYLVQGGKILAWNNQNGRVGQYNTAGNFVNRATWNNLLKSEVNEYGSGELIYLGDVDYGTHYYDTPSTNTRIQVADIILERIQPQIISSCSPKVNFHHYINTDSSMILTHIVNNNWDILNQNFVNLNNFEVSVKLPAGIDTSSLQVSFVTAETQEPVLLDYTFNDEMSVSFTVPELMIHDIIYINHNTYSPVINYTFPSSDITIAEGDTVNFIIGLEDIDNSILTYLWFVNDTLRQSGVQNFYSYLTNYESFGTDTIKVKITDGKYNVEYEWIVSILDKVQPNVIFDESHENGNTISLERALQMDSENPEFYYFGVFKDEVAKYNYNLSRFDGNQISSTLLESCHILVISSPQTSISASEIEAVKDFISKGGSLLLISDAGGLPHGFNNLTQTFNITFGTKPIASLEPEWDPQSFIASEISQHPITDNVKYFHTNWSSKLNLENEAKPLIKCGADCWVDENSNGIKDLNEESGPLTLVALSTFGDGKVVCISDDAFHDSMIELANNKKLISNIIKFLVPTILVSINEDNTKIIPENYSLYQNYPNPFNPSTTIRYSLPKSGFVQLKVYDVLGREVASLVNKEQTSRNYKVEFNASNLTSGIYFYRLQSGSFTETKKLILLR